MAGLDLELLRSIFKDDGVHITLAVVDRVQVSDDRTNVSIDCTLSFDGRQMVVTDTWGSVGDNTTHGDLPDVKDLVLVAFAEADDDHGFLLLRLASGEESLPKQIVDGHYFAGSKPGKKYYLVSDTGIFIGKGDPDAESDEPLVLGKVAKQFYADQLTQLSKLSDDLKQTTDQVNSVISAVNNLLTALAIPAQSPGAAVIAPGTPIPASPALVAAITSITSSLAAATSQLTSIGTDASGVKTSLDNLKSSPVNDGKILSDIAFTEKGS